MILYTTQRYEGIPDSVELTKKVETEEGSTMNYFYVDRATYDQAVILNHIYSGSISKLATGMQQSSAGSPLLDFCKENLPEPINILGAFLAVKGLTKDFCQVEYCAGILNQMSKAINFLSVSRINVSSSPLSALSLDYLIKFEDDWATITGAAKTSNIVLDDVKLDVLRVLIQELFGGQVSLNVNNSGNSNYDEEDDEDFDPFAGLMDPDNISLFDSAGSEEEQEEKKEEPKQETTITTQEVTEPVVEEKPAEKTEEDILLSIMARMNA